MENNNNHKNNSCNSLVFGRWPQTKIRFTLVFSVQLTNAKLILLMRGFEPQISSAATLPTVPQLLPSGKNIVDLFQLYNTSYNLNGTFVGGEKGSIPVRGLTNKRTK